MTIPSISPADANALAGAKQLDSLLGQIGNRDLKKIEKAAKDFESVLLNQMLKSMEQSISRSGLTEEQGSQQIRGMFYQFLSQDVADKGGIGLWKELYRTYAEAEGVPKAVIEKTL